MTSLGVFFEQAKDYHVLVAGDVMLDGYLRGRVDRISPEAPVPILQLHSSERRLGGAANVALNLRQFGSKVSLMSCIGDDESGAMLREMCTAHGIDHAFVQTIRGATTTVKTRVIGGHQHLLRIDDERYREASRNEAVVFREQLDALSASDRPHAIILQDYNKGFLSSPMIRMLLNFAKMHGIPVCVDPKSENFFEYEGVAVFKPNFRELKDRMPFQVDLTQSSLAAAARYLAEDLKCEIAAITLSEHGIFLARQDEFGLFPTKARNVVDVCGAGDAVISVLTMAYLMGLSLSDMAQLSNVAGGVVCSVVGVCPVDINAMRAEIGLAKEG